ncbi:hypothetical protein X943_001831, partial [Babesia divergens]
MSETCDFQDPGTLKDILEELGKLHNATTSTRHKVFQQLRDGLNTYCGTAYLDAFYGSRDYGFGSSMFGGSILLLTKAGQNVSEEILKSPPSWHGHLDNTHKDQTCGEKYFNALKECLPKAYAALYYLYFMGSQSLEKTIKGGKWHDHKCDGTDSAMLNKWLTDDSHAAKMKGLIKRGFSKEDLHDSNTGQKVAEQLKNAVSLRPDKTEGSLQNVLCGFMFVCKWDDALTGHAICFLYKFCDEVMSDQSRNVLRGKLEGEDSKVKFENLNAVCTAVQGHLYPFTHSSDSGLSAVCHGNTNLFDSLWDNEKFDKYCDWLKGNLHYIIGSLEKMSLESSAWDLSTIQSGFSAGPFKYGFVFKDSGWDSRKDTLQSQITELTASLRSLLQCLNGESSPTFEASTEALTQESAG